MHDLGPKIQAELERFCGAGPEPASDWDELSQTYTAKTPKCSASIRQAGGRPSGKVWGQHQYLITRRRVCQHD